MTSPNDKANLAFVALRLLLPPQNRRLCLPQSACALAVMRLDRYGFANKFLIRWNYNTIFHFCGRNLQIFSKKCYEKSQKRASKAENKGWGGLLSFCEFFWGFVWVWEIFLGLLNFLALFGKCWEIFLEFVYFFQIFGEILNLFGNFKICWKNLNFLGNFWSVVCLYVSGKNFWGFVLESVEFLRNLGEIFWRI